MSIFAARPYLWRGQPGLLALNRRIREAPPDPPPECGTPEGYMRHVRNRSKPCQACAAARNREEEP